MSNQVVQPFEVFFGRDGMPVENGVVYVGEAGFNPETNPIALFWDEALSIPAANPVALLNGYLSRSGSPGKLYVASATYSITVRDSDGRVVYSDRNASGSSSGGIALELSYTNGASESLASTSTALPAGGLVQTGHYDSVLTVGSGTTFQATGATNAGKASNCPDADGYFYDAAGMQFAALPELGFVSALWYGAAESQDNLSAFSSAIAYCNVNDIGLRLPAGNYPISGKLSITRPSNDVIGFTMIGAGRGITTLSYTGASTFDYFIELSANTFSINNNISAFGINASAAPSTTGGIRLNAGVWRSTFNDLYIRKSGSNIGGYGIYGGSAAPADSGFFDNKFSALYIVGFERGMQLIGTAHSGNTITNTTVLNSYISSCDYGVYVSFANGFCMFGSQVELSETAGLFFEDCYTSVILGGSIESPVAGAIGIDMDANTRSVVAICDFFNNTGGHFLSNGALGNIFKTSNSGLVFTPGSELRMDADATDVAKIRFWKNGVADNKIGVAASGNALAFSNQSNVEHIRYIGNAGVLDFLSNSYIRFQNGTGLPGIYSYHGSPEGVLAAPPGSICLDSTGGAGTSLFVKEAGSGNTGWVGK